MDYRLNGKLASVTAGAHGIGEALADLATPNGMRQAAQYVLESFGRARLPGMAGLGSAAVVNIGSDLAKQPAPTLMDYGTCKAGLLYLSKALAKPAAPSRG